MTAPIYLDYQATTPLDPRVLDAMLPFMTTAYGNPSSLQHCFGLDAADAVELGRQRVAQALGADRREIFFTSGATEANNLALKGLTAAAPPRRRHLIALATEHRAVLEPIRALVSEGFEATFLRVDRSGFPDLDQLDRVLNDRTLVVSIAAANSEIGTLPSLRAVAELAHSRGALLHTDAAQALGKIPLDVEREGVDLLSVSAHKIYGPKGIGALYVRREHRPKLQPLFNGGGQEQGLRSGTLNVPGIVGFGAAAEAAIQDIAAETPRLIGLCNRMRDALVDELETVVLNGPVERLPGNLNLRFVGVDAEALIANCPQVAFSAGSACSAGAPEPSHVLLALGLTDEEAEESVRFSLGRPTTSDEVDAAVGQVVHAIARIRSAARSGEKVLR
jgi:cysteine desulfurase